jgi:predicted ATPase/Tfp pilus assembly protein PilF
MGKTRLALEAAASVLNAFPHGVYFVPLASVGEAAHAVPAIVKAMDLNPSGPTPPKTELLNYLHDAKQPMLLLIDNLEHVLEGADVLSELLSAAPQLKLLATSRERLNLQEEWVFEVRGMASPPVGAPLTDAADLEKYNAARLFLQRARQADARFHPSTDDVPAIARICQLMDGMPLGLELAAPWVRSMTCCEIADEIERNLDFLTTTMRNVPERHRSLRAVLEQTWERLTQVERDALRQLSVFQGGCTREAAEAVTGASVATLSSLMGRALLRRVRDGRYELHELIRQFAAEKLQPGDQEAAQQRHTDYFTRLAERARPELDGPDQLTWFDRLEREHPNLRAALTWSLAHNLTLGLQLAVALMRFWSVRGYLSEGRRWLHDLLTSGDSAPQALRAGALVVASRLAYSQGDFRAALDLAQSGQDLSLQLENALGIAQAQLALGLTYLGLGDYVSARTHMEESLALCRSEADQPGMAEAFNALGHIAQRQGDYAAAKSFFAQALELYRGLNDPRNTAGMSLNLGVRAFEQGDYETAHRLTEASLVVFRQLRDTNGIATALLNLGNTLLETGNLDRARGYFEEAITLERSLGSGNVAIPLGGLGRALRRLGDLKGARACFAESLQLRLQAGDRRGVAVTLTNFAHIFQDDHRPDRAARLLGAAEALRTAIGAPIHPNRREEYEQLLAEVRAALGEAGFADAWAEGGVLTLEQAVALALK